MITKAKWEDLRIGLKVREYPSQEWFYYVREIYDDKVFYSSNSCPNARFYITKKQFGKEFHELFYDDGQLTLF